MTIAILGTGNMGSGMAEGFIKAGQKTIVYDITPSKTAHLVALGATAATTSAEAIMNADVSIIVVPDGNAIRNLLLNNETKAALKNKKILNAGTTTPAEIEALEKEIAEAGGDLSEISMLIGADQLRNREGSFLLASNEANKEFWTSVLKNIGESITYVGTVGNASKAESPMLFGSMFINAIIAYSAAVAHKLNIPHEVIYNQVAMFTSGGEYLLPSMFARDYTQVMASTDNFKSVSETAISTAKSLGMPTKSLEGVLELFDAAVKRGFGSQDGSSIVEVLLDPSKD